MSRVYLLTCLAAVCSVLNSQAPEWDCATRPIVNQCDEVFGPCQPDGTCQCLPVRNGYDCSVDILAGTTGCGCTPCLTPTQCSCDSQHHGPMCEYDAHNVQCGDGTITFSTLVPNAEDYARVYLMGDSGTPLVFNDGTGFDPGFDGYRGTVNIPAPGVTDPVVTEDENGKACIYVVYQEEVFAKGNELVVPFCCGGTAEDTIPVVLPFIPQINTSIPANTVQEVTVDVTVGGVVMQLRDGNGDVFASAPPSGSDVQIQLLLNLTDPMATGAGIFVDQCTVSRPDGSDPYDIVLGGCGNHTSLFRNASLMDLADGPQVTIVTLAIVYTDDGTPGNRNSLYTCTVTVCGNADDAACAEKMCMDGETGYGRRKRQAGTPQNDNTGTSRDETLSTYLVVQNPFAQDTAAQQTCPHTDVVVAAATASLNGTVIALGSTIIVLLFIIALLSCFLFQKSRRVDTMKA